MPYTLLEQGALDHELPLCAERGVGVVIGAPFGSGILAPRAGCPLHLRLPPGGGAGGGAHRRIAAVCARHNVPLGAAALQFPLGHPSVASVIPGPNSPQQVRSNVQWMRTPIPAPLWSELKGEGLLRPDAPCPSEAPLASYPPVARVSDQRGSTLIADCYLPVYRATDLRTGGPVAVKALHPAFARDPVLPRAPAPGGPGRGRADLPPGGAGGRPRRRTREPPFLVLEYVAGETLQARWRREGRLAPGAALAIVLEVARALEDAHAQGIVHRDLKPQNVMLADGQVKVLDFGIARVAELPGLTAPGRLLGTPAYAPRSGPAGRRDARADIYALGVILYALLEGEVPFRGPTPLAVLRQHEAAPAPPTATPPRGAAGARALPGQGPRPSATRPRRAGRGPGGRRARWPGRAPPPPTPPRGGARRPARRGTAGEAP